MAIDLEKMVDAMKYIANAIKVSQIPSIKTG